VRIVLAVPAFPEVSETFIATKFAGLVGRGLDVQLVCHSVRDDLWDGMPALRDVPGLRSRVHVAPGVGAVGGLGPAARGLIGAAVGHPQRAAGYGLQILTEQPRRAPRLLPFDGFVARLRPDVVHFEFGTMAAERAALRRLTGASLSASFRGWDINWFGLDNPAAYATLWREIDAVHCLGTDLLRRARRRGLPEHVPVTLIPPAVDVDFFTPPPASSVPGTGTIIGTDTGPGTGGGGANGATRRPMRLLTIARLHWKKGHEHALAAVAALVAKGIDVEYRIIGSGPHELAVRAAIEAHGLTGRVHLEGPCPPAQVREHLWRTDVLLHAATSEGFCNAVLEAQACGVPVVCSDADGLAENVADGVTGCVVPRRDPAALARALEWLAGDAGARARMGRAGRRRVAHGFRAEEHIDRWVEYFERQRPAAPRRQADLVVLRSVLGSLVPA
jgi:colanic acid/amylovoran biosynthesis glycosyltransferase